MAKNNLPFPHSHAFIIGINAYQNGISTLSTAVQDARDIAALLGGTHGYTLHEAYDATRAEMLTLFDRMKTEVGEGDRLLFYFAGHGIAQDSEKDPQGFLVPADADREKKESLISMDLLHDTLRLLAEKNKCKHGLIVLDCCFAGAFKWSTGMRSLLFRRKGELYEEHFHRFVESAAWQVITSSAHDQKAVDVLQEDALGKRHPNSPFARAFKEAIQLGQADVVRGGRSDEVITATELYLYLRDAVEKGTGREGKRQSPALFTLGKHDKGEYIFLHPSHQLRLPHAPFTNPFRGLSPFRKEDAAFFFGREAVVEEIAERLTKTSLLVISAPSGQGKSSTLQAGLFPYLEKHHAYAQFLTMRPGATPAVELAKLPKIDSAVPQVLVIDQYEELFTDAAYGPEQAAFEKRLAELLKKAKNTKNQLKIVLAIRSDFEWQLKASAFGKRFWEEARITDFLYRLPVMRLEELRQVMLKPLWAAAYDFEKEEMVDHILAEINNSPAALPLLSFTLYKLYELRDKNSGKRLLKQHSYTRQLKGINGVLSSHADMIYKKLPSDSHRRIMHKLMLRMIRLNDGSYSRRRVYTQLHATENTFSLNELSYSETQDPQVKEVLKILEAEHLLVQGKDDVGHFAVPMHDSLINHWDRCLAWVKTFGKDNLLLQRQLWQGILDWEMGADPVLWDTHPKLSQVIQSVLMGIPSESLRDEQGALWRGVKKVLADQTGKEKQQLKKWLDAWKQSDQLPALDALVFMGASLPLLKAILAAGDHWLNHTEVDFIQQSWEARIAEVIQLKYERDDARATVLAAKARQVYPEDPTIALNLAYAAYRTMPNVETQAALAFVLNEPGSQFYQRLGEEAENVMVVAFSPDGKQVVSGGDDNVLRLWSVESRKETDHIAWPTDVEGDGILCVAFSPDGKQIISGSRKGQLRLWSLSSKKKKVPSFKGHQREVKSVAFSHDGTRIVSGSRDHSMRIWSVASGKEEKRFDEKTLALSVSFSPDDKYLVSGSYEVSPRLWSVKSGKVERRLEGHTAFAQVVSFSPDGKYILSGSDDHSMILWAADSGKELKRFHGHKAAVRALAFSADSSLIVSGSADQTIRLWAVSSGSELAVFRGHARYVTSVAISQDKQWIVSSSYDKSLRLWPVARGQQVKRLEGHAKEVMSATFSPDGDYIISSSADNSLRLWAANSGEHTRTFDGHAKKAMAVAFSPSRYKGKATPFANHIASGSYDKSVRLWSIDTGEEVKRLEGHTFYVLAVAFSPDGTHLLSGSSDKSIRLWEIASGKEIKCLKGHGKKVMSVAFSPDGVHIISGSADASLRLWSVSTGEMLSSFKEHKGEVTTVAFSPDGTQVLSGSTDKSLRLWSVASGKEIKRFEGHSGSVSSVAFSPDGSRILSGTLHKNIRLWDVSSGEQISHFKGHSMPVNTVAFSPDGNQVLSGSDDGSLILRRIMLDHWNPDIYRLNEAKREKYKITADY